MMRSSGLLDEHSLLKKCEDDLFRLALVKLEKKEAERLQAESETGNDEFSAEDMEDAFRRSLPRVERTIQSELRKQHILVFCKTTLPRVCNAIACVLLVLFIGATTALAVSKTARVYLKEFLINIEEEYTEIGFITDADTYVDVPEGWGGKYFMSYIPDGFDLIEILPGSMINNVCYINEAGDCLRFSEYASSVHGNIDTEGALVTLSTMNGQTMLRVEKEGNVTLAWAYAESYFIVSYDGRLQVAEEIAKAVVQIR